MSSSNHLWKQFANYENFLLAWQRTVNVTSRMVHDELGMKTFAYNLQTNLEDLVQKVQEEVFPYLPLADHKVYVPKPSTTLRTMSLMAVPDAIVYQAIVNVIADSAHIYLVSHENEHVFGNLYAGSGKRWMLQPWKSQYHRFVRRVEALYRIGNSWIASTDIVAFYDTIDHERLLDLVCSFCGEDEKFKSLLRKCLSTWSAHSAGSTIGRGIPQGSNASDFLANLYLYEIDRKLIANGYHYIRYVDDVRILGTKESIVQRGLIMFDLELKCAGLVAQVTKTSVHKIEDIEKEILRLRFTITDPTGSGDYTLLETSSFPASEQAGSVSDYIRRTPSEQIEFESDESIQSRLDDEDISPQEDSQNHNQCDEIHAGNSASLQEQLRSKFLAAFDLLSDPVRGKEAESNLVFCLYRLDPHESIRSKGISLLDRLPWRSEAISAFLRRFNDDRHVIDKLTDFVCRHQVYSWHRANALWTLYKVSSAKYASWLCREWLADNQIDWYARTIAARILSEVPGQHSYLLECLKREQEEMVSNSEATAILRQELAHSAFTRIKSPRKQLALLQLICSDKSPILHRLAIYLLQRPTCAVNWDDLKPHHENLNIVSNLVQRLGLSGSVSNPCFIAQTLAKTYKVSMSKTDLRPLYAKHYDKAVENLRDSVIFLQHSPGQYISKFHQFTHLTLIAFYQYSLHSQTGVLNSYYHDLIGRTVFKENLPRGVNAWQELNNMRNRVDHPVDRKTQSHSTKVTLQEVELLNKQMQVALQEMFDFWLKKAEYFQGRAVERDADTEATKAEVAEGETLEANTGKSNTANDSKINC